MIYNLTEAVKTEKIERRPIWPKQRVISTL